MAEDTNSKEVWTEKGQIDENPPAQGQSQGTYIKPAFSSPS